MVQWVKNLTAVAWVAAKIEVQSLAWQSGLKDLALPQPGLGFNPWPRSFYVLWVWLKKKQTKKIIQC